MERDAGEDILEQPVERRLRRYAGIATLLFVGQAVWAIVHLATGGHYARLQYVPTAVVVDGLLVLSWAAAAVATATRWSRLSFFALVGCAASLSHGVLASVSTPFSGVPFLLLGLASLYCVFRAMPLLRRPMPIVRRGELQTSRPIGSPELRPAH